MRLERLAYAVGGALLIAAMISAWPAPTPVPEPETIAAVVADIRESLADVPDDQRRVVAGTSAALADWVRHDPPESVGDIARVGRLAYRIGGWETGSHPTFSAAFGRAFDDAGLGRDTPLTAETTKAAVTVFDSIAKGADIGSL